MFRQKNILCLLLCALLLTSCGQTTDTQESSDLDTVTHTLSDTETIEPETDYYATLEEGLDYEGYTFNDLSYNLDPAKLLSDYKWYSYFFTSDKSISSRWESTREKIENAYADLWDAATKNQ